MSGQRLEVADLRESLLFRLNTLEFIRLATIRSIEAGENFECVPYLFDLVITDCRKEISDTFQGVKQT